jgi:drug/metabolite transporter (DMT)-like permease
MNSTKIIGIVLLVAGVLGLVMGGFSFTKETHKANIGPISMSVEEKQTVNIPLWASIAALVAGAAVLVVGSKK